MKTAMASSADIEERAARWLTQRDSGEWTGADERALQSWLDMSVAHEVAFIRLEAVWNTADRLQAFGSGVKFGDVPPPDTWHLPPVSPAPARLEKQKNARRIAIAASMVVALACAGLWYLQTRGTTYRTAVGGFSSVPLQDGSRVTLNTDSKIQLDINKRERAVRLERGEAYFEAAPDPQRPFVVKAGSRRITAVGTQFSVRRVGDDDVEVVVTEGRVRVEDDSSAKPVLLDAGGIARAGSGGLRVATQAISQVNDALSWRTGFVVFRDAPLSQAAAEFNRYNTRKLLIQDATIASIPVSGRFRTDNVDAFVRLVQSGFPVQAHASSETILLTHRESPRPAQ